MISESEPRAAIDQVRATLESEPADRATIEACGATLTAVGGEVTSALEAEFLALTLQSEDSAA